MVHKCHLIRKRLPATLCHMNNKLLTKLLAILICCTPLASACQPDASSNVVGYVLAKQSGIFAPNEQSIYQHTGTLVGRITTHTGSALANATVVVAERSGTPHTARTNAAGTYQISNIPAGQYVPAAIASGFQEGSLTDRLGLPTIITIQPNQIATAPDIQLTPKPAITLPHPLDSAVRLTTTSTYTATAPFPANATATVTAFAFENSGAQLDTLRLYTPLPNHATAQPSGPRDHYPILFMVYPTPVDLWQTVSVAYAAQGYAVVAISPAAARLLNIEGHALDAIIALQLAQSGALGPNISSQPAVALGGSFSSAILNRVIQNLAIQNLTQSANPNPTAAAQLPQIAAWVTVGGIGNAFDGAADFYADKLTIPPAYTYAIPALGPPHLYPLTFLSYSPVYAAEQFPPTLLIHTNADLLISIQQAYDLETALRTADIPVEVFYYEDVSHYLQIDENMTDAGAEMFYRILNYVERFYE